MEILGKTRRREKREKNQPRVVRKSQVITTKPGVSRFRILASQDWMGTSRWVYLVRSLLDAITSQHRNLGDLNEIKVLNCKGVLQFLNCKVVSNQAKEKKVGNPPAKLSLSSLGPSFIPPLGDLYRHGRPVLDASSQPETMWLLRD